MGDGKIRWGILGVAKINQRLIPGFQKAANAELSGIASRSLDRARRAAAEANIPVSYGSYEQLLQDPKIDAVYIPLPNSLHAEWSMRAAEHGKHVLCEKPLASNAAEAEQVVEYFRAQKVRLMEGFMWPHHPRTARLRQLLDSGTIGEVKQVVGSFTFLLGHDLENIRMRSDLSGGSAMDIGCYPIYGACWTFQDQPVRISSFAEYQNNVDTRMNAVMEFPGGRTASFDCGFTLGFRDWLEISGTEGSVCVMNMWLPPQKAGMEIYRDGRRETVSVEGEDQIVHMIQNFGRGIMEKHDPVPLEQSITVMKVLDAVRKSAQEGCTVDISSKVLSGQPSVNQR